WAVGGGLRIRTPVGPVRVDLGFRLNRFRAAPADEPQNPRPTGGDLADRLVFHLSLGEAF
ncbi:MAG: outer membrane protein assembly factor, partial [Deltaproteobacteria bacterium]|nr:outer membrane protein assembly factor [Deltaproteobacteria bacterium]